MMVRHYGRLFIGLLSLAILVVLSSCGSQQSIQPARTSVPTELPTTDTTAEESGTEATTQTGESPATSDAEIVAISTEEESQPMSVEAIDLQSGRDGYAQICAPCHGLNATGIDGIGVDLTESQFVAGLETEQLADFLIRGMSINSPFNVSGIRMPPRGGHDEFTDQEMLNIAAYLQNKNDAVVEPSGEERISTYLELLESGEIQDIEAMPQVGNEGLSGAALDGQTTYLRFCAVCHGPNGEGVETLGRALRQNQFISDLSDKNLAEFLKQGRSNDDPLNETGIEMLPYGGQPYLTDDELSNIVAYLRFINAGETLPQVALEQEDHTDDDDDPMHLAMEAEAFAIIDEITPRCFACHFISERGNKNGPGPSLNGLNERAESRIPGMSAEDYVRQSILDPGAFMVEECPRGPCVDVMVKNYHEKIAEEDLDTLVNFLLSLPPDSGEEEEEAQQIARQNESQSESSESGASEEHGVDVRAVNLLEDWVNEGAVEGAFPFTAEDGNTYTATFDEHILPLFVTPGIWYAESEACINCHYEQSEDSDHEMDMGSYEGIMAGADVLSSPPGVPIVIPGDWENSVLRSRLRNTRMPPDPGWEWDPTEENRDGPTLTVDGGEVRAVDLVGEWVDQGAEEGSFTFTSLDGETYAATFDADILPLFTEPGAWYTDSAACIDCHFEQSEDSDHEMDMSSYEGIMAGADVLSSPPGVPIVIPGDWDNSVLRSRLRDTRMPPSPGWEWDPTEENRDGPTLNIIPLELADEVAEETEPEVPEGSVPVRAVDFVGAWVDAGAEQGEFPFEALDGETYIASFDADILPLFTETGAWYAESEACINCHYEQSEDSDHEMDMSSYEGIMAGADVISSPPGVPIVIPGDWENSVLRSRLRNTRMPPDPGWEWDPTEENRDGPTLTVDGGEVRAVDLVGEWVDQGAEEGSFTFTSLDGETYAATFDADILPLFTEPGAWYTDSAACIDCHFEQSEDSDHEMDMSSYEGIMAGADVLSSPPGVSIVIPGDWDNSVLRSRLRDTRMPPSPGWEWDPTEENRDGPTLNIIPLELADEVAEETEPEVPEGSVPVRAVDFVGAWVDAGAEQGEFPFEALDGETYIASFDADILPLFTETGAWYAESEACINCHYEQSEDSDHEMDMGSYEGIMAGADVLSSPPGVPIVIPGDWENSVLRSRLRNTRMPPDPGWEWDPTEENRDGPTLTVDGGEVRAVDLVGEWVDQGAEEGSFTFTSLDGETYAATFDADILPLFTEPGAWYTDSAACIDCHFEQSEDSDHEMDMSSYEGIMAGADVLSSPPGVPIVIPGDWDNSVLRSRLRDTRMPPSPGWEWDPTEENRDGPTLYVIPQKDD